MSYRALRRRPRGWLKDRGIYLWTPLPGWAFQDRSATPSTPATNGGALGTILEYTGVGPAAIAPSSGASPTLKQSGSFWYADYDGIDDNLQITIATLASTDLTLAKCMQPTNFSGYQCLMGQTDGSAHANPNDWWLAVTTGVPSFVRNNGSGFGTGLFGVAAPSTSVPTVVRVVSSGSFATHYLNGATNNSGTFTGTPGDSGQALNLGRRADGGTLTLGKVWGDAVAPSALSATDQRHLDIFLAALAGVQL